MVAFESSNAAGDGSGYGIQQAVYGDPATFSAIAAAAPVIDGLTAAATFAEDDVSAAPQRIDADGAVALSLAPGVDLDGARLTIRMVEAQEDQGHDPAGQHAFSLLSVGDLPGQVNHDGATVTYEGVLIGTVDGSEDGQAGGNFKINLLQRRRDP